MVTKKDVGRNGDSNWTLVRHLWLSRLMPFERAVFVLNYVSVSTCYSLIYRQCLDEYAKRDKKNLSVITAPIVLAHLIDFLNRQCHVNNQWSNIHPANLIRIAYSRYKHIRANTFGVVMVSSCWPKYEVLRLIVETMPIYKAVATGNRNNELYREPACSNWK